MGNLEGPRLGEKYPMMVGVGGHSDLGKGEDKAVQERSVRPEKGGRGAGEGRREGAGRVSRRRGGGWMPGEPCPKGRGRREGMWQRREGQASGRGGWGGRPERGRPGVGLSQFGPQVRRPLTRVSPRCSAPAPPPRGRGPGWPGLLAAPRPLHSAGLSWLRREQDP